VNQRLERGNKKNEGATIVVMQYCLAHFIAEIVSGRSGKFKNWQHAGLAIAKRKVETFGKAGI